jgi:hypothetical protein
LSYDPSGRQLSVAAAQVGIKVYTNVVVTVGSAVSVAGRALN